MLLTSINSHISENVCKSFMFSQYGTRTHSTNSSSVKKNFEKIKMGRDIEIIERDR